jgi:hypothetical protein
VQSLAKMHAFNFTCHNRECKRMQLCRERVYMSSLKASNAAVLVIPLWILNYITLDIDFVFFLFYTRSFRWKIGEHFSLTFFFSTFTFIICFALSFSHFVVHSHQRRYNWALSVHINRLCDREWRIIGRRVIKSLLYDLLLILFLFQIILTKIFWIIFK